MEFFIFFIKSFWKHTFSQSVSWSLLGIVQAYFLMALQHNKIMFSTLG